jgi:DNA repair exonuclease SbcCD nuclease subunit
MERPIAVLISDIHYDLSTLPLADASTRMAITKANDLNVPLIVAGDLHNTKANLRGECVNAMIETFKLCNNRPYILIGNHDRINEKAETHSLNFLSGYANVIDRYSIFEQWQLMSYYHDPKQWLREVKTGHVICHQGLVGSAMGDYIQDKSAITSQDVAGLRVISGHYHQRQTIPLPNGGTWDYIGNPYTLSFGEANDPEKGFQILYSDGSLEFVPTNLRKHVIIEHDFINNVWSSTPAYSGGGRNDIIWVKVTGTKEQISSFNKNTWCEEYGITRNIKLTFHPIEISSKNIVHTASSEDLLDNVIDGMTNTSDECKTRLKDLWKNL